MDIDPTATWTRRRRPANDRQKIKWKKTFCPRPSVIVHDLVRKRHLSTVRQMSPTNVTGTLGTVVGGRHVSRVITYGHDFPVSPDANAVSDLMGYGVRACAPSGGQLIED